MFSFLGWRSSPLREAFGRARLHRAHKDYVVFIPALYEGAPAWRYYTLPELFFSLNPLVGFFNSVEENIRFSGALQLALAPN